MQGSKGGEQRTTPRRGRWSQQEIARLRELYGLRDDAAIARELNRPVASVRKMAREVFRGKRRTGPWTADEVESLKLYLGATSEEVIAQVLGRSVGAVRSQAERLSMSKDKAFLRKLNQGKSSVRMPRWTDEELATLERMYPDHPNLEIARLLGRSVKSVVSKAHNLGLKKSPKRLRNMGRENVSLRYDE